MLEPNIVLQEGPTEGCIWIVIIVIVFAAISAGLETWADVLDQRERRCKKEGR